MLYASMMLLVGLSLGVEVVLLLPRGRVWFDVLDLVHQTPLNHVLLKVTHLTANYKSQNIMGLGLDYLKFKFWVRYSSL